VQGFRKRKHRAHFKVKTDIGEENQAFNDRANEEKRIMPVRELLEENGEYQNDIKALVSRE